jgi:hypothetical protein
VLGKLTDLPFVFLAEFRELFIERGSCADCAAESLARARVTVRT